jgi:Na+/glutamate symporter
MNKLLEILKAAIARFSKINLTMYLGIATIIIDSWLNANLVTPSFVLFATGVFALILKAWNSSRTLVETGYNFDWSLTLMGIVAAIVGVLDTWVTDMEIINFISRGRPKAFIMIYLAVAVIIRTGFTNQSAYSVAQRKINSK